MGRGIGLAAVMAICFGAGYAPSSPVQSSPVPPDVVVTFEDGTLGGFVPEAETHAVVISQGAIAGSHSLLEYASPNPGGVVNGDGTTTVAVSCRMGWVLQPGTYKIVAQARIVSDILPLYPVTFSVSGNEAAASKTAEPSEFSALAEPIGGFNFATAVFTLETPEFTTDGSVTTCTSLTKQTADPANPGVIVDNVELVSAGPPPPPEVEGVAPDVLTPGLAHVVLVRTAGSALIPSMGVTLDGVPLISSVATPTALRVELPAGLTTPGPHQLRVVSGELVSSAATVQVVGPFRAPPRIAELVQAQMSDIVAEKEAEVDAMEARFVQAVAPPLSVPALDAAVQNFQMESASALSVILEVIHDAETDGNFTLDSLEGNAPLHRPTQPPNAVRVARDQITSAADQAEEVVVGQLTEPCPPCAIVVQEVGITGTWKPGEQAGSVVELNATATADVTIAGSGTATMIVFLRATGAMTFHVKVTAVDSDGNTLPGTDTSRSITVAAGGTFTLASVFQAPCPPEVTDEHTVTKQIQLMSFGEGLQALANQQGAGAFNPPLPGGTFLFTITAIDRVEVAGDLEAAIEAACGQVPLPEDGDWRNVQFNPPPPPTEENPDPPGTIQLAP